MTAATPGFKKGKKQKIDDSFRALVIKLRRRSSIKQVAELVGLPIGTVKTICSRSGLFRDNEVHRALFTLPPIRPSEETTLPQVLELPPQQSVTGDKELDAVLWLSQVIDTGQPALIDRALEAAAQIKTPAHELEKRYARYLMSASGNSMAAVFGSFNFANLEGLAKSTIERERRRAEAAARFDDVLALTDAELFCIEALHGLEMEDLIGYDREAVAERFHARPDLMPQTLSDCLHELEYWNQLYWLRNAVAECGDPVMEGTRREWFVSSLMAEIRPRSRGEAKAVLRHLVEHQCLDSKDGDAILDNLIGGAE